MKPITFSLKDYSTRKQLEIDITNKVGNDPNLNKVHSIEGTEDELKALSLSERTAVFGVRCVVVKAKKAKAKKNG